MKMKSMKHNGVQKKILDLKNNSPQLEDRGTEQFLRR
jgi:hypothetical protein